MKSQFGKLEKNSKAPEVINGQQFNRYTEKVISNWKLLELSCNNKYVSIDGDRLLQVAQQHYSDQFKIPEWKFQGIYPVDNAAFSSSVLTYNVINAAFYFPGGERYSVPFGDKELDGSFGMLLKFYQGFGESVITTKKLIEAFGSKQSVIHFFRGFNEIPYPELRFRFLQDFIKNLLQQNQDPIDLLHTTGSRAFNSGAEPGLVDLLITRFPLAYGSDHQSIGDLDFPFFKRAQLVALLLHGRAVNSDKNSPIQPFSDINLVGPISDYQVPRALRGLEIIQVDNSLAKAIQSWKPIPKDSAQEIELRAATVVACASLLRTINNLRHIEQLPPINICHLDYWLWSQAKIIAKDINPHITKTMAY